MIDQEEQRVQLRPQDLLRLGLANLAYVKERQEGDKVVYAVYAADGSELGMTEDRDVVQHVRPAYPKPAIWLPPDCFTYCTDRTATFHVGCCSLHLAQPAHRTWLQTSAPARNRPPQPALRPAQP